jgi:hypothetical protein
LRIEFGSAIALPRANETEELSPINRWFAATRGRNHLPSNPPAFLLCLDPRRTR